MVHLRWHDYVVLCGVWVTALVTVHLKDDLLKEEWSLILVLAEVNECLYSRGNVFIVAVKQSISSLNARHINCDPTFQPVHLGYIWFRCTIQAPLWLTWCSSNHRRYLQKSLKKKVYTFIPLERVAEMFCSLYKNISWRTHRSVFKNYQVKPWQRGVSMIRNNNKTYCKWKFLNSSS